MRSSNWRPWSPLGSRWPANATSGVFSADERLREECSARVVVGVVDPSQEVRIVVRTDHPRARSAVRGSRQPPHGIGQSREDEDEEQVLHEKTSLKSIYAPSVGSRS